MNMCRQWLAAVLGGSLSYVVELRDGTQFDAGRQHCAYCARAHVLTKLSAEHGGLTL